MSILIHSTNNFDSLNEILSSGKISPFCQLYKENKIKNQNFTEYDYKLLCSKSIDYDKLYNEKKDNINVYLSFMNIILDINKINSSWDYQYRINVIIDIEALEKNKNNHIHITYGWNYGNIGKSSILYNKYENVEENIDILKILNNFYKKGDKDKTQNPTDWEIVSKEFDISEYIIGFIFSKKYYGKKDEYIQREILKMKEFKEKYPQYLYFNSFTEFKKFK
jgi:hypothetical protein